jgi:hypothetical protein
MFLDLRKKIVDLSELILRKTGLNDKIICIILRILHFGISIITLTVLLFGNKKWFIMVVLLNLFVFILYFIFGGCILSKIEHRFTNDDFTVIDPLLIILNIELTNDNRYYYSLISNIFGTILMGIVYYIRFVTKPVKQAKAQSKVQAKVQAKAESKIDETDVESITVL